MMVRRSLAACSLLVITISLLMVATQSKAGVSGKSAGRIVPGGSMMAARADHTATLLPDGRVLITGGMVENGVFLESMEIFDPKTGRFSQAGNMASKRVGHSATLLPNGKILIAGGLAGRNFENG